MVLSKVKAVDSKTFNSWECRGQQTVPVHQQPFHLWRMKSQIFFKTITQKPQFHPWFSHAVFIQTQKGKNVLLHQYFIYFFF